MSSGSRICHAATWPGRRQELVPGRNGAAARASKGIDVPPGFATTSDAFRAFIKANNLNQVIADAMEMLDSAASARWPRPARRSAPPLSRATGPTISARRSCRPTANCPNAPATPNSRSPSAPAPPPRICPDASFAGQQETYLNVRGEARCCRPAAAATPRCSPTGRSPTARSRASTTTRWRCRSACS
jgi:hypothetical protein